MRIGFMMGYNRERMEFAKKNGFKSAELSVSPGCGFFPTDKDWKAKAKEVQSAFADMDIRISCLAAFYMNHMDPKIEVSAKRTVRNAIILAEYMNVPAAAGFAGRIIGKPALESVPKFVKIWSEHAKFADDHGIKIAFEHCPMAYFGIPINGSNMICTPEVWEIAFSEVKSKAIGLEWDPSHLICQMIDPVKNLRKFGNRVYHVHAKDAKVNKDILAEYGLAYEGTKHKPKTYSTEHCFPGVGDTDWGACIKELYRHGYDNDLNIEGWHDAVYRDKREDEGLIVALKHLSQFVVQD